MSDDSDLRPQTGFALYVQSQCLPCVTLRTLRPLPDLLRVATVHSHPTANRYRGTELPFTIPSHTNGGSPRMSEGRRRSHAKAKKQVAQPYEARGHNR